MINKIKENIWQLSFKSFGSCVYFIKIKEHNILIDTSSPENRKELIQDLKELNISSEQINMVLMTHEHWDHIENIDLFKNAKIYDYNNIDKLNIKEIKVVKTPGHTKDSICFLYNDILFSGDTIFHNGGIGRTDLINSQPEKMQESLEKLSKINYEILCPGHID